MATIRDLQEMEIRQRAWERAVYDEAYRKSVAELRRRAVADNRIGPPLDITKPPQGGGGIRR